MIWGIVITAAILGVWFACVLKAEGGETYEDRQRKLADKMMEEEEGDN